MILFGTRTLPIQDNIVTLAGFSIFFELGFYAIIYSLNKKGISNHYYD